MRPARPEGPSVRSSLLQLPRLGQFAVVPRDVRRLIGFLSFLTVGQGFYYVFVTGYLAQLGVSGGAVGLILGASGATFVLSAIPFGLLSDRYGRKRMLILGTMGLPPALLVYAVTTDVPYLVLAGVLIGLSQGAFLTSWNAMIADRTTLENRDAAFSMSFFVNILSNGVGAVIPVTLPIVAAAAGIGLEAAHRYALAALAALGSLSPISLALLVRRFEEVRRPARTRFARGPRMGLLLKFSAINGLIGLGAGFIIPLIPLWLFLKFGAPDSFSGPLLALSNLTIAFAAMSSAGLAKRYGPVRAIALTEGLSTVFMVSVAFAPNLYLAGGLYVVRAALMMMPLPISDSYLMSIIDPQQRGIASAINSIVWRLPNSVSTIAGGFLLAQGQYTLPFLIAASFYITSIVSFYVVFRNVRPGPEGEPSGLPRS